MPTFSALQVRLRDVEYVVLASALLQAFKMFFGGSMQTYYNAHPLWTEPAWLNLTTTNALNDTILGGAAFNGTWDVTHLAYDEQLAKWPMVAPGDEPEQVPFFSAYIFGTIVHAAWVAFVGHHWNVFLERRWPARPRGKPATPSEKLPDDYEQMEEELIRRWVAAGRIQRPSISIWNTLVKWVLDITVGRGIIELMIAVGSMLFAADPGRALILLPVEVLAGVVINWFTMHTLSSLIGMFMVAAKHRVVFGRAVSLGCIIFLNIVICVIVPWFFTTEFGKVLMEAWTDLCWLKARDRYALEMGLLPGIEG